MYYPMSDTKLIKPFIQKFSAIITSENFNGFLELIFDQIKEGIDTIKHFSFSLKQVYPNNPGVIINNSQKNTYNLLY